MRALEVANRQKQIEVIEAEQDAAVEKEKRQVEADVRAYDIRTVAQAKLDAAEKDAQAAEKQALAISTVGRAEAEVREAALTAENVINERVILAQALDDLLPLLPDLVEKLMLPAEKIDSIKILNVNGLDQSGALPGNGQTSSVGSSLIGSVLNVGMVLPVVREIMKAMRDDDGYAPLLDTLRGLPGGKALLDQLEDASDVPPSVGDGSHEKAPPAPPAE